MTRRDHIIGITGVAVTVLMWAAAYPAITAALRGFDALPMASLRYLCASLALCCVAAFHAPGLPDRRDIPRVIACGALGISFYSILLNTGQRSLQAGMAALIVNVNPVVAALLGAWTLKERLSRSAWAGIAIAFAGTAIVSGTHTAATISFSWDAVLVLLAAFCLGAMFVVQKPLLAAYHPVHVAMWIVWSGSILLLPFLPRGVEQVPRASEHALYALLFLGVGPAALAYVAWAYALARYPVTKAAGFIYLVAPLAVLLAYLFLGEQPRMLSIAGGMLTIGGVYLINRRRPGLAT